MKFFGKICLLMMLCGILSTADAMLHASLSEDNSLALEDTAAVDACYLHDAESDLSTAADIAEYFDLLPAPQGNLLTPVLKNNSLQSLRVRVDKRHFSLNHKFYEINRFIGDSAHQLLLSSRRYSPNFLLTSNSVLRI